MTLNEFKAWLDGYTESWGHDGLSSPSVHQWSVIRDKLATVEDAAPVKPTWSHPHLRYEPEDFNIMPLDSRPTSTAV